VVNARDVDAVIQAVRFELYRENVYGALELAERAHAVHPDARYAEQAARIRSWLTHLESREAYIAAQEAQYQRLRWKIGLKLLERRIRILLGRKTRKMIGRRGAIPSSRSSCASSPACSRGAGSTLEAAREASRWRWVPGTPTCAWRVSRSRRRTSGSRGSSTASRTSSSARASPRRSTTSFRPGRSTWCIRSPSSNMC